MYGIIANVINDSVLRTGAKVWIHFCNGDAEYPNVSGLSRHGRRITKYISYKKLTNFRVAWIPEHMRDKVEWAWESKETPQEWADGLKQQWQKQNA